MTGVFMLPPGASRFIQVGVPVVKGLWMGGWAERGVLRSLKGAGRCLSLGGPQVAAAIMAPFVSGAERCGGGMTLVAVAVAVEAAMAVQRKRRSVPSCVAERRMD